MFNRRIALVIFAVVSAVCVSTSANAGANPDANPDPNADAVSDVPTAQSPANFIQQRALGPIKNQTGLPEAASRLSTRSELQLSVVHNNVFMGGTTGDEVLVLDGESSQLNVRYRRKINACLQLNFNGVWLAHSNGWFDEPVDWWHKLFGLPDANRDTWPSNQLQYSYWQGDQTQRLTQVSHGFGDAQLQVQHNLGCKNNTAIVRAGLKLPLGKSDKFFGNGAVDSFVDIQSAWKKTSLGSRWQWAGSVGVLASGNDELLAEQNPLIGFGVLGLNYTFRPNIQLLGQIDWHSPMFDSGLVELGNIGAQLTLGLRYDSRAAGTWEFSFSEDAAIDTTPDIIVRMAWIHRFN